MRKLVVIGVAGLCSLFFALPAGATPQGAATSSDKYCHVNARLTAAFAAKPAAGASARALDKFEHTVAKLRAKLAKAGIEPGDEPTCDTGTRRAGLRAAGGRGRR